MCIPNKIVIMRRYLAIITILLCTAIQAFAQMSDDQVVDYVKKQTENGISQKQIVVDLLGKGVSQQQLERLKSRYQNAQGQNAQTKNDGFDRTRVSNGEKRNNNSDEEFAEEPNKIQIFGHDIFRSKDLSFEPNMNISTPVNYTLGPGDEVILDIYGASQYSGSFKISPDGTITIPNEGPVNVSGLTVTQAQAKVRKSIGAHYQGSTIKVTVGQTRTIIVSVMGEVKTPGTYTLSAFATVFNALYLAGGINDIGTMREVKVSRNGRVITQVDIYDYIVNGRLTGNIMLQDNDVIIVGPYQNLVKIEGKIKRPMYYEMKKTESVQSLLQFAGGFTGDAYKQKIRVERKSDDGLTVHNIDEWDYNSFRTADGDIVVVGSVIERYKNTVKINGAVFRPGQYKIDDHVNTVKTLVEQAGGLMEQAVTTRVVLHRMRPDRTLQTMAVNLKGILDGTSPDVVLQNEDELVVSTTENIAKEHMLYIYGDIFNPGQYRYASDETVEDLITEAGGLRESASLVNVEVARRITSAQDNPDGTKTAIVSNITLSNGLAIEGESGFKLKPFDIVTVHRSPDYVEQKVVYVDGEVKYRGAYVLSNKDERLTDIIRRSGGMTKNAYVGGVQVIRRVSEKELDIQRLKLDVAKTAADSIEIENNLQKRTYNVGVDLHKAIAKPGSSSDIVLQDGDSIYVPLLNNVVKISGEVMFPNTVAYEQGKSYSYYINQAGGVSKQSKKSLAYVIYPNGQVSKANKGKILPGCEIVLPKKPEKKFDSQRSTLWITAASTVATIAAVLISALK